MLDALKISLQLAYATFVAGVIVTYNFTGHFLLVLDLRAYVMFLTYPQTFLASPHILIFLAFFAAMVASRVSLFYSPFECVALVVKRRTGFFGAAAVFLFATGILFFFLLIVVILPHSGFEDQRETSHRGSSLIVGEVAD